MSLLMYVVRIQILHHFAVTYSNTCVNVHVSGNYPLLFNIQDSVKLKLYSVLNIIQSFIHLFCNLSYKSFIASSKTSSPDCYLVLPPKIFGTLSFP